MRWDECSHETACLHAGRWAKVGQETGLATWLPSITDATAMPDEKMGQHGPLLPRERRDEILLDLFGRLFFRETHEPGKTLDMGINDHTFVDAKRVAQHDIRSLPSDARQC